MCEGCLESWYVFDGLFANKFHDSNLIIPNQIVYLLMEMCVLCAVVDSVLKGFDCVVSVIRDAPKTVPTFSLFLMVGFVG